MRRTRPAHHLHHRTGTARVALAAGALLAVGLLAPTQSATAAPGQRAAASAVDLGAAAGFSVLAGPSIANTGPGTVLALDLGVSGTLAGFPPGTVTGETHVADAAVETAQEDRQSAYDAVVAQTGGTAFAGDLAGTTFTPGLYSTAAAVTNTGTITLDADGDPSALFVFQVGAALSSAAATKVVLTGGALANNVYWQVVGAVSLGANAKWVGTLLGAGVISFGDGASLKGRALTPSTVALANSPVTKPIDDLVAPVVAIDGGATRSSNDTTPSISGTTDEPGTPLVSVTIGSQVLTQRADAGVWTLSADALPEGVHTVVASITDPSGNTGTASQALTVDTTAPVVAVAGGSARASSDTTPTITGTTTEPGTPTVTVTVAGQTLTTAAGAGGAWTVDAATLSESSHSVVASVVDAAGNVGTGGQVLTIDVTVPVLTVLGGAARSTTDTSPWTYGSTAEQAGSTVRVTIGGQELSATVQSGGTWGVSAQELPAGAYPVVASITDAAQNTGTATQLLTIGTSGGAGPADPVTPVTPVTPVVPAAPATPGPSAAEPRYQPDAEIRSGKGGFVGAGSYDAGQRVSQSLKGRARTGVFEIRLTNRGDAAERLAVRGSAGSKQLAVAYLAGGQDVTRAVLDGSYRTTVLESGETATLTMRVTRLKAAKKGAKRTFQLEVASSHVQGRTDTVAAVVKAG